LKLLISILFLINIAHATVIKDYYALSGPQIIGGNFNSTDNYFDTGLRCVQVDKNRDVEVIYNEKAIVLSTSSINFNSIIRELGGEFSIGGELPMGDPLSFASSFLKAAKEDKTSIVFNYKTEIKTGSVILKGPFKLAAEAQDLGRDDFAGYCGDQFVHQIDKGAKAFVAVKIDFGTEENKRAASAALGFNLIDFIDLTASIKKLRKKTDFFGKVTVAAYQEGGFAARINSIFGSGRGVTHCSGRDFTRCEVLLKEVVHYFSREFVEQFDHYYRDASGSGVITLPPSAKTLSYKTQSYCKLAPNDRPQNMNCSDVSISQNLEKLGDEIDSLLEEHLDIEKIKLRPNYKLAPEYQNLLDGYQQQLKENIHTLRQAKLDCKKDKWSCESSTTHAFLNLNPKNKELLDSVKEEGRVRFCFDTGMSVELSALEMRLKKGGKTLETFTLFDSPNFNTRECLYFHAPDLKNMKFDKLEVRTKTLGEDDGKCKIRAVKKFSSWLDWDLKSVSVTHMATGYSKTFEGSYFKKKRRCMEEDKAKHFLPWKGLTLRDQHKNQ
jgi:hypothetical protein